MTRSTTADAQQAAGSTTRTDETQTGFSAEERAALQERAAELKTRRGRRGKADETGAVLAKIAEMPEADRALAERLHAVITANAPQLAPRLWYGMPAYADGGGGGKVVCFFQGAAKFGSRYATLGFNDPAKLDEGTMWPTAFALTGLTAADEELVGALVRRAVG